MQTMTKKPSETSTGTLLVTSLQLKTKDHADLAGLLLPSVLWNLLNLSFRETFNLCLNNKPTIVLLEPMDAEEDIPPMLTTNTDNTESVLNQAILMLLEIKHADVHHAPRLLTELLVMSLEEDLQPELDKELTNNLFPFAIRPEDGNLTDQEF